MTCAERSPLVNDIGNRPSVRATLRREQSIAQSPPIKNEKRQSATRKEELRADSADRVG